MNSIKELNFNELTLVSGGEGHGTEVNRDRQDARNQGGRGISYGGQANGFQPGYAAGSLGITKDCALAISLGTLGVVGSLPSRNAISIGSAVASAGIAIDVSLTV